MPIRPIGYGLIVIGFVAIAAMIIVALIASTPSSITLVPAILGFAASTIGGVLVVVNKLEEIAAKQEAAIGKLEVIHELTNSAMAEQKLLLAVATQELAEQKKLLADLTRSKE